MLKQSLLPSEEKDADADRLALACYHVQAGIDGRAERPPPPPEAAKGRRAQKAFSLDLRLQAFREPAAFGLVLLSFFEEPLWAVRAAQRGHPGLYGSPLYPSFDVPLLPLPLAVAVEAALLALLALDVALNLVAQGFANTWAHRRSRAAALLLAATAAATVSSRLGLLPSTWLPIGPYVRVALVVVHSHQVRNQLRVVRQAVPSFAGVALLLLLFLLLASWLATILFPLDTAEGRDVMPSFGDAAWQLLILLSTANFPDVMMPAYAANRAAFLFFGTFLVLGLWFLMNLLLAVIFDSFNSMRISNLQAAARSRATHLGHAFNLLDVAGRGSLDRSVLSRLLDELDHAVYDETAYILHSEAAQSEPGAARAIHRALVFAVMDASGDSEIQRDEFANLCGIMHLSFRRHDPSSVLDRLCDREPPAPPGSWCGHAWAARLGGLARRFRDGEGARLRGLLGSAWLDRAIDAGVVLSAAALATEAPLAVLPAAAPAAHAGAHAASPLFRSVGEGGLTWLQLGLTALFAAEVSLKAVLLPTRAFLASRRHRFDLGLVSATLVATIAVYLPGGLRNGAAVKAMLVLRLLRLLRLLTKVRTFRGVIVTFVRTLPAARALLLTMLLLMYTFAATGTHLFGGLITTDRESGDVLSPRLAKALEASAFGSSGYYPNSFNDLPSGMVTLFELLVVNNWFVIVSGYEATAGVGARAFFIAFYVVGVIVMLNVCVAFVIQTYSDAAPAIEARGGGGGGGDGTGAAGAAGGDGVPPPPKRSLSGQRSLSGLVHRAMREEAALPPQPGQDGGGCGALGGALGALGRRCAEWCGGVLASIDELDADEETMRFNAGYVTGHGVGELHVQGEFEVCLARVPPDIPHEPLQALLARFFEAPVWAPEMGRAQPGHAHATVPRHSEAAADEVPSPRTSAAHQAQQATWRARAASILRPNSAEAQRAVEVLRKLGRHSVT